MGMMATLLLTERPPLKRSRPVREFEVMRVSAQLAESSVEAVNAAREHILDWAERRAGSKLPREAWKFESFELFSGGRNSAGVRIEGAGDLWALRAEDPDKNVAGRNWSTEAVVGCMPGMLPRFSMRLLCNTSESELIITPHTPNFVFQIAGTQGLLLNGQKILTSPEYVSSDFEAELLIDHLLDSGRKLPVIDLTGSFCTKRFDRN